MFSQLSALSPQIKGLFKSRVLLTGLVLSLGMSAVPLAAIQGQEGEDTQEKSKASVTVSLNRHVTKDGIYLYGESAAPNQIKQEYFVFQVRNHRVVGAVFMPRSSFDCFYGTLKAGQLDVKVVDSYEQTTYAHQVDLQDYQPIARISSNDQRILNVCQAANQVQSATR